MSHSTGSHGCPHSFVAAHHQDLRAFRFTPIGQRLDGDRVGELGLLIGSIEWRLAGEIVVHHVIEGDLVRRDGDSFVVAEKLVEVLFEVLRDRFPCP